MDDREMAELAALPAILQQLIAARGPRHDDTNDPTWRAIFEDANYLAQRFGGVYARSKRD